MLSHKNTHKPKVENYLKNSPTNLSNMHGLGSNFSQFNPNSWPYLMRNQSVEIKLNPSCNILP